MIVYLLKVNLALVLFYAGYHFILQRYTFHTINRFYLLIGLAYSAVYPLVDLSIILNRNEQLKEKLSMLDWQEPVANALSKTENTAGVYWQIVLMIFWTGVIFMSLRLLTQLSSVVILHVQSSSSTIANIKFRKISKSVNPFSFWRTIYLNPECHEASKLRFILEHELVHVKQLHTFDVMIAEISTIFYWFNPGVWLMKKAIKANLEFITDQEVIKSGIDSKEYQYALLKSQVLPQSSIPVNNFHFLTIKKRIAMKNKKSTNSVNLSNYVLILPAIMLVVLVAGSSRGSLTLKEYKKKQNEVIAPFKNEMNYELVKDRFNESMVKAQTVVKAESSKIYAKPDTNILKVTELKALENDSDIKTLVSNLRTLVNPNLGSKNPIYIIDGIGVGNKALNISSDSIASVYVYKVQGKAVINNLQVENEDVISFKTKSFQSPVADRTGKAIISGNLPKQNQNILTEMDDDKLIILDGKEITKSDLDQLKVSSISTINILNGTAAVNVYGEKGINGVIIITTKQ